MTAILLFQLAVIFFVIAPDNKHIIELVINFFFIHKNIFFFFKFEFNEIFWTIWICIGWKMIKSVNCSIGIFSEKNLFERSWMTFPYSDVSNNNNVYALNILVSFVRVSIPVCIHPHVIVNVKRHQNYHKSFGKTIKIKCPWT